MNIKSEEQRQNFKADYRISHLSLIGLLGFIVGCIILFGNDLFNNQLDNKTVFSEVKYRPEEVIGDLLKEPIDSLDSVIAMRAREIEHVGEDVNVKDPNAGSKKVDKVLEHNKKAVKNASNNGTQLESVADLKVKQENDKAIVKILRKYASMQNGVDEENVSDFDKLNRVLHFDITPASLNEWQNKQNFDRAYLGNNVKVSFIHEAVPFQISKSIQLVKVRPDSDIQFINKYPAVGVWSLLIMIFISFCFIAIANSIKIAMKLKEIFIDNDIRNANPFAYYRFVLIICFCLFLLNLLWKNTFFDEKVIKSIFFLPSLHSSLMWVIIVGYVAGAFCLGGFIYTAGALGFVDDNIQALRNETNLKVNNFRKNVGLDKEGKPDEISDINKVTEEHTRQIVVQGNLVKSFNTYFLLSSVILSLMVLCTGGLNSLVNSLDFVKLLNDDWGYSPARTDFVLLYGGIHTVLLLLVYLPARMRFNEIPLQEIDIPDEAQSKGWHEIIKNPFASFKDLLVVGSPFLASIVQALFDLLFNK